jgi:hypothetical protein
VIADEIRERIDQIAGTFQEHEEGLYIIIEALLGAVTDEQLRSLPLPGSRTPAGFMFTPATDAPIAHLAFEIPGGERLANELARRMREGRS